MSYPTQAADIKRQFSKRREQLRQQGFGLTFACYDEQIIDWNQKPPQVELHNYCAIRIERTPSAEHILAGELPCGPLVHYGLVCIEGYTGGRRIDRIWRRLDQLVCDHWNRLRAIEEHDCQGKHEA